MFFSEIIGQQEIKKRLIHTVAEQRIPHAQLLRGAEGIGKLQLAIAYDSIFVAKTEPRPIRVVLVLRA